WRLGCAPPPRECSRRSSRALPSRRWTRRAWAAFRLERGSARISSTSSPTEIVAAARRGASPPLLGQALEVLAAAPRRSDPLGALAAVDEAIAQPDRASQHILRGAILRDHDPVGARAAWRAALERIHTDSIWAVR